MHNGVVKSLCCSLACCALSLGLAAAPGWPGSPVMAEEPAPAAPVDLAAETNELSENAGVKAEESKSAYDQVVEMKDRFLAAAGLQEGNNPGKKGKQIYTAVESVTKPVSHPDFGKFRVTTYQRAYHKALEDFIRATAVRVENETINKFFADNGSDRASFDEEKGEGRGRLEALFDKLIAAGDAKLSEILRDLGVDPAEFDAVPPDQKKVLLSRSLLSRTVETANKSLGGVSVIQTFFAEDDKGQGAVGVVLVYSPLMEGVADALRAGRKPAVAATGKPLAEILPLDKPELLYDMLGTRLLTDENGPVVVAFGQWANSYSGNDATMAAETRNAAFRQAELAADKELSSFLSQSFTLRSEQENGEIFENAVTKSGKDGSLTEGSAAAIVDMVRSQSANRTKALLTGAATLKRWKFQTPNGHEIVGVVKAYSFANIEEAKATFKKPEPAASSAQPSAAHDPSARAGAVTMDLDTF